MDMRTCAAVSFPCPEPGPPCPERWSPRPLPVLVHHTPGCWCYPPALCLRPVASGAGSHLWQDSPPPPPRVRPTVERLPQGVGFS